MPALGIVDGGAPPTMLSRDNATWLLDATGMYRSRAATRERDMRLGRALGRALAHELGHYLLASKSHTAAGLMRAAHSDDEFFAPSRAGFQLSEQAQVMLAAVLERSLYVVTMIALCLQGQLQPGQDVQA